MLVTHDEDKSCILLVLVAGIEEKNYWSFKEVFWRKLRWHCRLHVVACAGKQDVRQTCDVRGRGKTATGAYEKQSLYPQRITGEGKLCPRFEVEKSITYRNYRNPISYRLWRSEVLGGSVPVGQVKGLF